METKFRAQVFGFFDILREGWKIYRLGLTNFVLIAVLVYLPQFILTYFFPSGYSLDSPVTSAASIRASAYSWLFMGINLFQIVAVAYLVEHIVQGQTTSLVATLRYALSRFPAIVLIAILLSVVVIFGGLLLIIPGLFIGIYLVFTLSIVALRKNGFRAFQYSISLVKGQWWRVIRIYFCIAFISVVFTFLLNRLVATSAVYIGFGAHILNLIGFLVAIIFPICQVVFFLNQDYVKHPIETVLIHPEQGIVLQTVEPLLD